MTDTTASDPASRGPDPEISSPSITADSLNPSAPEWWKCPQSMHLCLPGGGTKAAIASLGVLLAVAQLLHEQSAHSIASITAVSGSALLVARLQLTGNAVRPSSSDQVQKLLRSEAEHLVAMGFAPRFGRLAAATAVIEFLALYGLAKTDPGEAVHTFFTWSAISLPVLAGVVVLIYLSLPSPANLQRKRRRLSTPRRRIQNERNGLAPTALLPAKVVQLGVTNVATWRPALLRLADQYTLPDCAHVAPVARLASASAALPGVFPPVEIDMQRFIDGGLTDNEGLYGAYEQISNSSNDPRGQVAVTIQLGSDECYDEDMHEEPTFIHFFAVVVLFVVSIAVLAIIMKMSTRTYPALVVSSLGVAMVAFPATVGIAAFQQGGRRTSAILDKNVGSLIRASHASTRQRHCAKIKNLGAKVIEIRPRSSERLPVSLGPLRRHSAAKLLTDSYWAAAEAFHIVADAAWIESFRISESGRTWRKRLSPLGFAHWLASRPLLFRLVARFINDRSSCSACYEEDCKSRRADRRGTGMS